MSNQRSTSKIRVTVPIGKSLNDLLTKATEMRNTDRVKIIMEAFRIYLNVPITIKVKEYHPKQFMAIKRDLLREIGNA
jgi:hypothetical protein